MVFVSASMRFRWVKPLHHSLLRKLKYLLGLPGRAAAAQGVQLFLIANAIITLLLIAFDVAVLAVKPRECIIPGSAAAVNHQVKR